MPEIPCICTGIGGLKVMITIFSLESLILNALLTGRKFHQGHFLEQFLPSLLSQKMLNRRKNAAVDFMVHMDNSVCHNAPEISLELEYNRIGRCPHPADSLDISSCDFWLFGFLKEKLKEQELSTSEK
jgi:hypothetical protein